MNLITRKLIFPLARYKISGLGFGDSVTAGRILGVHLGEDARAMAGTEVKCVGNGEVVYSALHPGSPNKGNWGNIVIIGHLKPKTKEKFYSLYGHLDTPLVKNGDLVKINQNIGVIAPANTPQNGWWPTHLHFAIYIGPWTGAVLPGYFQENSSRTKLEYWQNPSKFINDFKAYAPNTFLSRKLRRSTQ